MRLHSLATHAMNLSMQGISTLLKRSLQKLMFALPLLCLVPQTSHADATVGLSDRMDRALAKVLSPVVDYAETNGSWIGHMMVKFLMVVDRNHSMLERQGQRVLDAAFKRTPEFVDGLVNETLPAIAKDGPGLMSELIKAGHRELKQLNKKADKELESQGIDPTKPGGSVPLPIKPPKQFRIKKPPQPPSK